MSETDKTEIIDGAIKEFKDRDLTIDLRIQLNQDDMTIFIPRENSFAVFMALRWFDMNKKPLVCIETQAGPEEEYQLWAPNDDHA